MMTTSQAPRLEAATRPTLYFIGVTTGKSSILKVFPRWSEALGLGADIVGIDLPLHAPAEDYRQVVRFIRDDPMSKGALVTTHKYLIDDGQSGRLNAGMVNGGGGFSAGGKGPQIVRRDRENREVLQALVKLSGKHDFGFDEQAWRSWFINEQSSDRIRTRRDL